MSEKLQELSNTAIVKVRDDITLIGRLMVLFEVREITIYRWLESGDPRLTVPAAVSLIAQYTGLTPQEILSEPETGN